MTASVLRLHWASPDINRSKSVKMTGVPALPLPRSPGSLVEGTQTCQAAGVPLRSHELCLTSRKSRGGPSPLHTSGCSGGHWLHPGLTGRGCARGLGRLAGRSEQGTRGCRVLNVGTVPNKPFLEAHFSARHKTLPRQCLLVPYSLCSAAQLNCSR